MSKNFKKQNREGERVEDKPQPISTLERVCLFVIRWGVYLALFSPLIILKTSFFPFVTPKTIYFRILVEVIFGAWVILALKSRRYRPKIKSPLFIALSIFLIILILTSFTGIDLARSFWSTYERMTGLFTWFHLFAFFVVLTSTFQKRRDWEKILAVSVFVGVLLSLYVLLSDKLSARGGGTIGNTSFLAAYLLFDLFFALILFLGNLPPRSFDKKVLVGYSLLSLFFICWSFFDSSARGAIRAFFIGIFIFLLGYLLFSKKRLLKIAGASLILLAVIGGIILFLLQPAFLKISWYASQMEPRLAVWQIGWDSFKARPWLGWGPENFIVGFSRYFNPCLFLSWCGGEIWFDRVHNIILDTLTSTGIIGLLSYLCLFGVAVFGLLRLASRSQRDEADEGQRWLAINHWQKVAVFGVIGLLAAYLAQNLLVFDMINSYLVLFLTLSLAGFLINPAGGSDPPRFREGQTLPAEKRARPTTLGRYRGSLFLGLPLVILLIILLYFGNIKSLQTAKATAMMMALADDPGRALSFFKKSLDSWMLKYEPREQFSQKLSQLNAGSVQDRQAYKEALAVAVTEMEKSIAENPLDFRHHLFLGRLYLTSYYFEKEQEKLVRGREVLEKAIQLGPINQQGYWYLAELNFAEQNYPEAIELLKKAVDIEPRFGQSRWYLSLAYQLSQNPALALEAALAAQDAPQAYDWKNNPEDLKRMLNVYAGIGDTEGLLLLYQEGIERYPKDEQFYLGLANIELRLNQENKAKEVLLKLLENRPDLEQKVREFISPK